MQRAWFTAPLKKKKKKGGTVAYLWARQFFKPELNGEREPYRATSPAFAFTETCRCSYGRLIWATVSVNIASIILHRGYAKSTWYGNWRVWQKDGTENDKNRMKNVFFFFSSFDSPTLNSFRYLQAFRNHLRQIYVRLFVLFVYGSLFPSSATTDDICRLPALM